MDYDEKSYNFYILNPSLCLIMQLRYKEQMESMF